MKLTPEASVKRAVGDLLDICHIPYWRMNAGTQFATYKGKTRRIMGHAAGTADILAAPRHPKLLIPLFLWIECKRPNGGKQSEAQAEFQRFMESQGHIYLLATSSDDVLAKLRELGCVSSEGNQVKSKAPLWNALRDAEYYTSYTSDPSDPF